ncbi:IQ domain-containing protein N [Rhinolophus ferrumequinum]|uniref:IQ domain-containing protein N n=1 Tax=Rhinolophus ferrumequinum TaxID=59479 RepID=UPI00140FD7B2|nr:IQ domain-containing protein N [Rhinolophus ferrumequinum]
MQQATQLQWSPSGQNSSQAQPVPNLQDKAGTLRPHPQHEPPASRETLLQQPDKMVPHHTPRLRAVVESQAFKNVLVDEMDIILSRAATLIQSNWKGYRLRQKLISQMRAAKAIQEAWRRFNTRRLLRFGKAVEKKVSADEGDIPYHPPQQVRFQHSEKDRSLSAPPIMVSKETQFPSADSLAAYTHQLAPQQPLGAPQASCAPGGPSITFLPDQTISSRLPCPVSPEAKRYPCLLTRTVRSANLVHREGDTIKTKQVAARANKAGAPGTPQSERYAQVFHGPHKTQTQALVEAEVLQAPPQPGPAPVMLKNPLQPSVLTKTPLQSCLASMMNRAPTQPCPAPTATIAKTPPRVDPAAPVAKTTLQSCLTAILNKIPTQPCPAPAIMITKTPPQPCLAAPVTKTPAQMRPTASMTNTAPQTCPVPMMAKTPVRTCPGPVMAKILPQTHPGPVIAKTPPQMRLAATMAKTPLQTCPAATIAKTPSQTLPGASMTKTPPQTRLAAMITKTPAQLRSMATILRTLCLLPPTAGNLKASPPAVMAAGIPNTLSHTCLNKPKAKAVVTARQTVKISSHSYLTGGKMKYCPPPHLGAGSPKSPARPLWKPNTIKAFSQKQVKTATKSSSSVAVEVPRAKPWAKVAEHRNKVSSQARLRTDVVSAQTQVYVPGETAVVLPQAQLGTSGSKSSPPGQLATCSTTTSAQGHLLTELTATLPQAYLGTCLSKAPPQAHLPAQLTTAPSLAYPGTCLTKTQSQAHLATGVQSQAYLLTGLTKAQSQAQLVTETAKCLYPAHQAVEVSSKTKSQPLRTGFKASTQPYLHTGSLGTLSRAKTEDRLTQLPAHSYMQGKATQGPCQGSSKTQSMLVPLLASSGHPTCNVESWGDSGVARAQPSTASPAAPSQEELAASQLPSLCAELATVLGSQEDLRALLVKALSQGEVRAALNQALSKEILGATIAKAMPQSMLGTALVKALSWGELGAALSRVLSRGELRAELTKAMQGKLVDVLSKALTEEERAALSQALCQGELGAVLSQSLSQAALKTGLVLPKATASKTAGRGMMVMPAPVEVDYRGSQSTARGPTLSPGRPQLSKGPVNAGVAGGPARNSAACSVAIGPMTSAVAPGAVWEPTRCAVSWDAVGREAAVDPGRSGKLVASVQAVEKIIVRAVVTIQACARGYLVRQTIKVWHQWAVVIQAAWRGYRVRRDLAQLCRAATIIQATWRGYCIRRSCAQQMLPQGTWANVGSRARSTSSHRCFQSCQPHVCAFCQPLSTGLGSFPSVVMLVGSNPRTCHMCGRTLPTRVVQGMGQGTMGQADVHRGCDTQLTHQSTLQLHVQNKAATLIQSAWRGFVVRHQLKRQQVAAKRLQATWRGHFTRASLTTDALLGPAVWDNSQNTQWPGV